MRLKGHTQSYVGAQLVRNSTYSCQFMTSLKVADTLELVDRDELRKRCPALGGEPGLLCAVDEAFHDQAVVQDLP